MQVFNFEQRSTEWHQIRCGIPTASGFDKIITTKGEQSKQRVKYMYQLAGEKVCGVQEESYQNAAMLRGIELEAEARRFYEFSHETEVKEVGFCLSDCSRFGASPDGVVGDEGILEIKCPSLSTHVEYLINGTLPTEYFQQVHGQLLVTGCAWCDFVSYYPGIKPLVVRVERDDKFLSALSRELDLFCNELATVIERIS